MDGTGQGGAGIQDSQCPRRSGFLIRPVSVSQKLINIIQTETSGRHTIRLPVKYFIIGAITLMACSAVHPQNNLQKLLTSNANIPPASFTELCPHTTLHD